MSRDDKTGLCTEELMLMLQNCKDIGAVLCDNAKSINDPGLAAHLAQLTQKHNTSIAEVAERAILSRSFAYQVYGGYRSPGRDVLLRMAFAMQLSVAETQRLLCIAQKGQLYPRVRRDAAVIFCIKNGKNLFEINDLLMSIDEPPLV
ncbi:MAG: helix-turn-helix transcriptional regulator [Clostridia bacterium]